MPKDQSTPDLSPDSWNQRYRDQNTPWDLSGPTPEFARCLDEGLLPPRGRVLVPGGGQGHDAILFAQRGYEVDLVDFAPEALESALRQAAAARCSLHAYRQDFFDLPRLPYHQERYDIFLEYTFYCAIAPSLRPAYVQSAAALLRPGGLLLGLFFPLHWEQAGPPFAVSEAEVRELFAPFFELRIEAPRKSVPARAGREFLALFRKR